MDLRLAGANRAIADVNQKLGSPGEVARRIQEIGRDVASLQDVLQARNLRGNLGEHLLENLLRQVLPAGNREVEHPSSLSRAARRCAWRPPLTESTGLTRSLR